MRRKSAVFGEARGCRLDEAVCKRTKRYSTTSRGWSDGRKRERERYKEQSLTTEKLRTSKATGECERVRETERDIENDGEKTAGTYEGRKRRGKHNIRLDGFYIIFSASRSRPSAYEFNCFRYVYTRAEKKHPDGRTYSSAECRCAATRISLGLRSPVIAIPLVARTYRAVIVCRIP